MCGVFGAVTPGAEPTEAAAIATLGLFALQHRGQESAGVAVSDGEQLMLYKDLGMISTVLDERHLPSLRGTLAIAHCRYSTTGSTIWENAQPTYRQGPRRSIAIGHNGNLVNTRELLEQLRGGRSRLPASTDTELLTALLADEPAEDTVAALLQVLPRVRGAFSAGDPRPEAGHRRARSARVPPARPGPAAGQRPGRRRPERRHALGRRGAAGLVPVVGDGGARHRRSRVHPRRGARRDRGPGARAAAAFDPLRRGEPEAVRVRAHLLRPPRLVHGGAQPVRGAPADGRATGDRARDRRGPGHAGPRHRRSRRGRLCRGERSARTARACTATATRGARSSSRRPGCATGA